MLTSEEYPHGYRKLIQSFSFGNVVVTSLGIFKNCNYYMLLFLLIYHRRLNIKTLIWSFNCHIMITSLANDKTSHQTYNDIVINVTLFKLDDEADMQLGCAFNTSRAKRMTNVLSCPLILARNPLYCWLKKSFNDPNYQILI